jgi:hypothetical protein
LQILKSESDPGKVLINETLNQIADAWCEIENSGGSFAWEWILRGSPHGAEIRKAEDNVNAIGSKGDPRTLAAACDAWVSTWRTGIEAWERKLATIGNGLQQERTEFDYAVIENTKEKHKN